MRKRATTAILLALAATGCVKHGEQCLPDGEKATVLRTGEAEGYRYVTLKRTNGEEVTCTGRNTPTVLQTGDEVDGWTLERARATKPR